MVLNIAVKQLSAKHLTKSHKKYQKNAKFNYSLGNHLFSLIAELLTITTSNTYRKLLPPILLRVLTIIFHFVTNLSEEFREKCFGKLAVVVGTSNKAATCHVYTITVSR